MSPRAKRVVPKVRSCKYCGCTDDHACDEGCSWVAEHIDVCSVCVDALVPALDHFERVLDALRHRKAARS